MSIRYKILRKICSILLLFVTTSYSQTVDGDRLEKSLTINITFDPEDQGPTNKKILVVSIKNSSNANIFVNLGEILGNGAQMIPSGMHATIFNQGSTEKRLNLKSVAIEGRVDPYIIPLSTGASYTLKLSFDNFVEEATGAPPTLTPGTIHSIFVSLDVPIPNKSMLEDNGNFIQAHNYWTGSKKSNVLVLGPE